MIDAAGWLEQAKDEHAFRELRVSHSLLDFSSNDYLGLARSEKIRARLMEALSSGIALGATGSRLLSGHCEIHERVEAFLSRAFGAPSALLLTSGYLANLAVLQALSGAETEFFSDELNHASLIDGMRLTRCSRFVFSHNDTTHLEQLLKQSSARNKVIVTESVFSMDGDLAPLAELSYLAEKYGTWFIVDEAHATGVFGLGRLPRHGQEKWISIHTGGKAIGAQGAFVLSSIRVRDLMINRARSFIFTTGLAPLTALQIEFGVQAILDDPQVGAEVLTKAEHFRRRVPRCLGNSQIVPLIVGGNGRTLQAARRLQDLGFDVRGIRSPTVRKGSERLRFTLKAFHDEKVLERLISSLELVVN